MRVLQVHNRQLQAGGVDNVIENEAALLQSRGWEVERFLVDNREIEHLSSWKTGLKAIWNAEAQKQLRHAMDRFHPHVVHVHTPFPLMSPAVFHTITSAGLPAVTTMHSYRYSCVKATCYRDGDVCEDCVGTRLKLPAIRFRCYKNRILPSAAMASSLAIHRALGTFHRDVACYITISDFARDLLIRDGFPAEKIVTKPNSAPDPGIQLTNREDCVIYIGRLEEEKGILTLLKAWRRLRLDIRLRIVGDGSLRQVVASASERDGRIEFLGWKDRSDLLSILGQARGLVLPSEWYEAGLPLVAIEAFAVGTPVVASNVGNFSGLISPGHNGFHFQSGDSESLTDAIEVLIREPRFVDLSRAARETYEKQYSQEANLTRLVSIYRSVLARPSSTSSTTDSSPLASVGNSRPGSTTNP